MSRANDVDPAPPDQAEVSPSSWAAGASVGAWVTEFANAGVGSIGWYTPGVVVPFAELQLSWVPGRWSLGLAASAALDPALYLGTVAVTAAVEVWRHPSPKGVALRVVGGVGGAWRTWGQTDPVQEGWTGWPSAPHPEFEAGLVAGWPLSASTRLLATAYSAVALVEADPWPPQGDEHAAVAVPIPSFRASAGVEFGPPRPGAPTPRNGSSPGGGDR